MILDHKHSGLSKVKAKLIVSIMLVIVILRLEQC